MKQLNSLTSKLVEQVKSNKEALGKLAIFAVILAIALAYPMAAAIVGALACMIAIEQREHAKKSLSFFKVPMVILKGLKSSAQDESTSAEVTQAQEESASEETSEEVK